MGNMEILANAKSLWMKFNVRGAILTSLSLQVLLVLSAPIRKRCSNRWFMMLVWSAYLGADLVADYALGLISRAQITGGAPDSEADAYGDLLAFWAQFLLLHLGGQDTITAFAIEDNELWGRHLLNLLFQLGVAGYVFYQSFPSSKLIVPTVLISVGGTLKYIERIRALHLASFSKFQDSLLPPVYIMEESFTTWKLDMALKSEVQLEHVGAEDGNNLDDRAVIKKAFHCFTAFKGLLVDLTFSFKKREVSNRFFGSRKAKDAFRVIEAELNFFYDVLYTKAAVVHCPTGYLSRAISDGCIVSAFASFYVLDKHGFHEYDIQIAYTLLLGAIGLEFVALGRLICSDWTIARCLFNGSIFIKFLLKFKSESSPFALHILHARWSKSIFQYNFLDSRLRMWPNWIDKVLRLTPLGEFLDDLKFGRVEKYSEELGKLIFEELRRKASGEMTNEIYASRGKWALEHTKTGRNCESLLRFVCDVDYGKSLLLWHIATYLCYSIDDERTNDLRETSKVLSDYMLHLMIKQPKMTSAGAAIDQIRFRETCAEADWLFCEIIDNKRKTSKADACRFLLDVSSTARVRDGSKSLLFDAHILAKELEKFQDDKWEIASEVWVELLAYAAIHCEPFMHAQQLSKGGELLTLVWLLMAQLGLSEQFQIEDSDILTWLEPTLRFAPTAQC